MHVGNTKMKIFLIINWDELKWNPTSYIWDLTGQCFLELVIKQEEIYNKN